MLRNRKLKWLLMFCAGAWAPLTVTCVPGSWADAGWVAVDEYVVDPGYYVGDGWFYYD